LLPPPSADPRTSAGPTSANCCSNRLPNCSALDTIIIIIIIIVIIIIINININNNNNNIPNHNNNNNNLLLFHSAITTITSPGHHRPEIAHNPVYPVRQTRTVCEAPPTMRS
jgi:hypothetical protein